MNGCSWIVCERTSRWASALRLALQRDESAGGPRHAIREVRHLADLTAALAAQPAGLAAIEVHRTNLRDVLAWLASSGRQFPQARFVALWDRLHAANDRGAAPSRPQPAADVCDALREAGALEVVASPRQLRAMIELGRRHAAAVVERDAMDTEDLSLTQRVWASLPWQML